VADRKKSDIGFGKKVRGLWLDLALDFVANGVSFDDARSALAEIVMIDNPGKDATRKILVGLNRVWFNPPDYCRTTRDAGVLLYRHVDLPIQRLVLHWGMAIAAYPFIGTVAEAVGRLLRLQGAVSISDVKRRVGEKFGDREFVERIVRFNVSSFFDWGVIAATKKKGRYAAVQQIPVSNPEHTAWLIEALLHSQAAGGLDLAKVRQHPLLFPFALDGLLSSLAIGKANSRLQTMRHGHMQELVMLREN
jgi:hypothetical protein